MHDKPFYVVSQRKLSILYIGTMGMYQWYWFYKNWYTYRNEAGHKVWPTMRAIFAFFYVHSLLSKADDLINKKNIKFIWQPSRNFIATLLVLFLFVSNGIDQALFSSVGSPYIEIISIILLLPQLFLMRQAQLGINTSCDDAQGISNDELGLLNYIFLALGILSWVVFVLDLFHVFDGLIKITSIQI